MSQNYEWQDLPKAHYDIIKNISYYPHEALILLYYYIIDMYVDLIYLIIFLWGINHSHILTFMCWDCVYYPYFIDVF